MSFARRINRRTEAPGEPRRRGLAGAGLFVVLVLASAFVAMKIADPRTLPIAEVRVDGNMSATDPERLRARIAAVAHGGFFSVDVEAVRRSVESEPWVAGATVRRDWPDRLVVTIRERVALARWGRDALLDDQGVVFRPEPAALPGSLPLLTGPEGTEHQVLERFQDLQTLLQPTGLRVGSLTLNERRAWDFTLLQGTRIVVGRHDFDGRVRRFASDFARAIGSRIDTVEAIDLRYTNGFAVRLRTDAAAAAEGRALRHGEEG